MRELRSELEAYTAADEPPMRLAFDEVLTAARRRRQRRRSTVVAAGVAVVAAVGIAVPTSLMAPNPAPAPAAASVADCKAEVERPLQLACVARIRVQPHIGSLKLESPKLTKDPGQPQQPGTFNPVPTDTVEFPVSDGKQAVGEVTVQISSAQPGACPEYCTPLRSVDSWTLYTSRIPPENRTPPEKGDPAVMAYTDKYRVVVEAHWRDHMDEQGNRRGSSPLLTTDQMVEIATTPELLP